MQIGGCDRCIPRERSNLVFNGWIWSSLRRFRRRFSHSRAQHVRMSSLQAKCASFEVCFVKLPWNWPCPLAVLTCCSTQTAHRLPTDCPVHRNPQRLREVRYRHACSPYPQRLGRTHCLLVTNQDASVFPPTGTSLTVPCFDAHRCTASIERKVSLGYIAKANPLKTGSAPSPSAPARALARRTQCKQGQPHE